MFFPNCVAPNKTLHSARATNVSCNFPLENQSSSEYLCRGDCHTRYTISCYSAPRSWLRLGFRYPPAKSRTTRVLGGLD